MKIYMIRHGETDWNKKRKLQGQVDIPLNEFGKLLAKETAPALADVPFAVCYTSPLKRAAETARLALGGRGGRRHANAQCCRYQQCAQFLNLHLHRPPSQKLHPQRTAQPGSG